MKLSLCTDSLFPNIPTFESAEKVTALGFDTIEFWSWWDKDIDKIEKLHKEKGLIISAFCTKFISLVDRKCRKDYMDALIDTIAVAKRLDAKVIISQVGNDTMEDRTVQKKNLTDALIECAPIMQDAGLTLAIEPLNTRIDHAGYFLSSSDECADILNNVGSSNVKMLFDIYHQQISEGDICRRIEKHISHIAHFHCAGNPGRHELYNSELDYSRVFETINDCGYNGFVGLEYFPAADIETGLKFAKGISGNF